MVESKNKATLASFTFQIKVFLQTSKDIEILLSASKNVLCYSGLYGQTMSSLETFNVAKALCLFSNI